ncbi:hypothetical protein KQX54_006778 [Cotesia glomerata]|uniref:Uncharacterized protein n=1 Tax=Cotesia glomerata TaxID=32391 RepID=A0AAV7HYF4_COTGL|nr:hypothetical protein KQX54_006778 [Cotesia glomerata]
MIPRVEETLVDELPQVTLTRKLVPQECGKLKVFFDQCKAHIKLGPFIPICGQHNARYPDMDMDTGMGTDGQLCIMVNNKSHLCV